MLGITCDCGAVNKGATVGCQDLLKWKSLIWLLSCQHNLGEDLHLFDELLKVWLGRSVCCGMKVCKISYSRSFLIICYL